MAIPPSDFLPLNPQPQFNHEKNIRQILLGGLPGKKKRTVFSKTVKVIKNMEMLRNYHNQEETKDMSEVNVM